jgi:hypothetical protein
MFPDNRLLSRQPISNPGESMLDSYFDELVKEQEFDSLTQSLLEDGDYLAVAWLKDRRLNPPR